MKQILWTSALSLTVAACFTACSDSSSDSSYEIPSYKNEAALPDSCSMEIAKVDTAYYELVPFLVENPVLQLV